MGTLLNTLKTGLGIGAPKLPAPRVPPPKPLNNALNRGERGQFRQLDAEELVAGKPKRK